MRLVLLKSLKRGFLPNMHLLQANYLHKTLVKLLIAYEEEEEEEEEEVVRYIYVRRVLQTVFFICMVYHFMDDVKPLSLISFSLKSIIGMYLMCTTKSGF